MILSVFGLVLTFFSCNQSGSVIDAETYSNFQKKGNEITDLAQATLLSNVAKAMNNGGPVYAVEFCNLKASSLIDSLNQLNNCEISRVTTKNRNPENNLQNETDKTLWTIFEEGAKSDTIIQGNKTLVYYKTIKMGMPACLNCHGNPNSEIANATLSKIQKLYPNDLATGYKQGDFRGLWKVEFKMN